VDTEWINREQTLKDMNLVFTSILYLVLFEGISDVNINAGGSKGILLLPLGAT